MAAAPDRAGHVTSARLIEADANARRYLPMLSNACWIEKHDGAWSLTPEGHHMLARHARKP